MATNAQINANRDNARRSTGPRTPEGKSRSAANSTRHGLAGSFSVLSSESQDEFDELQSSFEEQVEPSNPLEQFLVNQMAQSQWRIARINRLETRALDRQIEAAFETSAVDPDDSIIDAMNGGARVLDTFQRYRAAAERSFYNAQKALAQARAKATQASKQKISEGDAAIIQAIDNFVYHPFPFLPADGKYETYEAMRIEREQERERARLAAISEAEAAAETSQPALDEAA